MQPLGKTPGGDARVDVCLYFLAAHRLKWIDIKFMQVGRGGGREEGRDGKVVRFFLGKVIDPTHTPLSLPLSLPSSS